ATAPGCPARPVFSNNANPADSPNVSPSRSSSHGRQGLRDSSSNESNPYRIVSPRLSTPPTTAASQNPASMNRAAVANTFALEEQAVEMTIDGPFSSRHA